MKAIRGKSPSGTRTQRPWHGHTVLFQLHSLTLPRSAYVVKLQQGISTEQKRRYLELMLSYGGERTKSQFPSTSSSTGHVHLVRGSATSLQCMDISASAMRAVIHAHTAPRRPQHSSVYEMWHTSILLRIPGRVSPPPPRLRLRTYTSCLEMISTLTLTDDLHLPCQKSRSGVTFLR